MMIEVVVPLGTALTRLQAGPSHPGLRAGPSFRLSRGATVPAHLEAENFFTTLLARFPRLRLVEGGITRSPDFTFRGLKRLLVVPA